MIQRASGRTGRECMTTGRPANGSIRARRVAYFVALVRQFPDVTRAELQETLGWSDEVMDQMLADFRVLSKELKAIGGC